MFIPRTRIDDPLIAWRVRLFAAGAILGAIGMAGDISWLLYIAMGLLVIGFFLRFVRGSERDTDTFG